MQLRKHLLLVIIVIIIGFLLGWLFPVEGPVDYIYDNYKAQKCAVKNGPLIKEKPELTEEELDFIEELNAMELIVGERQ